MLSVKTFGCDDEVQRISELSAENGNTVSVKVGSGNQYEE